MSALLVLALGASIGYLAFKRQAMEGRLELAVTFADSPRRGLTETETSPKSDSGSSLAWPRIFLAKISSVAVHRRGRRLLLGELPLPPSADAPNKQTTAPATACQRCCGCLAASSCEARRARSRSASKAAPPCVTRSKRTGHRTRGHGGALMRRRPQMRETVRRESQYTQSAHNPGRRPRSTVRCAASPPALWMKMETPGAVAHRARRDHLIDHSSLPARRGTRDARAAPPPPRPPLPPPRARPSHAKRRAHGRRRIFRRAELVRPLRSTPAHCTSLAMRPCGGMLPVHHTKHEERSAAVLHLPCVRGAD